MTDAENGRGEVLNGRSPVSIRNGGSQAPTNGYVPIRLDEALKYAVARVEPDPRNVQIVINCLGWDGRGARSLGEIGDTFDVTDQRIREIVAGAIGRMQQAKLVPDVVERSIALVDQAIPMLEVELCETLLQARLCFVRFACDALVAAAQVFRGQSPFEEASIGNSRALVKVGTGGRIEQLAARTRRLVQTRGCANMADLDAESVEIIGSHGSRRFGEAVARSAGMFEWLDQENGWFWYVPDRGVSTNPLINHIRHVMAVTPRIELPQLQMAVRRDIQVEASAPPLNVLAAICRRLLFVQLEGEAVVRLPNLPGWDAVRKEATLVKMLRERESVRGLLSDGRIFVAWKIDQLTLESGVLRVNEPVSSFIEGDYELVTISNHQLAGIQIRQRACWDMKPLMRWASASAGDRLILIFDRRTHKATGILGDDGFAAQVLSPEVNLRSLNGGIENEIETKVAGRESSEEPVYGPDAARGPRSAIN